MIDDYIKAHDEQIRADERAKLAKKLGGIEALAIKLCADIAALKGQAGSAPDAEGSVVNTKAQLARTPIEWVTIEANILATLSNVVSGEVLSQGNIVERTGQDTKLISRALVRLAKVGKVWVSGKNRGKRYWLPVPATSTSDQLDGEAQGEDNSSAA